MGQREEGQGVARVLMAAVPKSWALVTDAVTVLSLHCTDLAVSSSSQILLYASVSSALDASSLPQLLFFPLQCCT